MSTPVFKKYVNFTQVQITFNRFTRTSISFPRWKGLLNTFLTICYLIGLVAKTTLLENRFIYITFEVLYQTSKFSIGTYGIMSRFKWKQRSSNRFSQCWENRVQIVVTYTHTYAQTIVRFSILSRKVYVKVYLRGLFKKFNFPVRKAKQAFSIMIALSISFSSSVCLLLIMGILID